MVFIFGLKCPIGTAPQLPNTLSRRSVVDIGKDLGTQKEVTAVLPQSQILLAPKEFSSNNEIAEINIKTTFVFILASIK